MKEPPPLNVPRLVLPRGFEQRRKAIFDWFANVDTKLCNFVLGGAVRADTAQAFYKYKVESNPDLSIEDKQRLSDNSKLWRIPVS